jgi:histidinol-phosphatase (PHP family)
LTQKYLRDFHVHSLYSIDSQSTISTICQKAIDLELQEIGFADHVDFDPNDSGYNFFDYNAYTHAISNARSIYGNKLIIRKGIEIDYQHCFENKLKRWIQDKDFDFIIGSVHYINHEHIYQLTKRSGIETIIERYVNEVLYSIRSRLFDIIGHFALDYLLYLAGKKREESNFIYQARNVFRKMIANNLYLEINTRYLRSVYKETLPSSWFITLYIESGGRLFSVGSDAHLVEEVGMGIRDILDSLARFDPIIY